MATIDGDADLSEKADDAQIIAADENTETGTIESHKLVVLAGEVSEDEAPESAFDLVAVHGLFEDSQETWTPADETKTWLEANLYETYTNARIMTFGYETDESKDGISTRGSIRKKALQMLEELLELRKELKPNVFRPLIFVAHDIGGIIVKEV
ncbi:uncharacterized protein LY89DRAFT_67055 [Mollisia scopiformis]|uniref:DUF676 domain-containing protein n=1 Tax=Mollisia scopiformis TaxID=149040 RepID=A0A194X9N5_MOLSC|nr:uncharacterized protein LY89DRAFT_67055 [Mollisia scopiformis]KUJ16881.1 hypothetical protein LY89DRAFT_67055 [Mollisia scopiformis]